MKDITRVLVVALLIVSATSACASTSRAPQATVEPTPTAKIAEQDATATADRLLEALIAADFAGASADFDDTMKAALPESKLKTTWQSLVVQVGAYQERQGTQTVESVDQYLRVVITLQFEKAALDMRVVVDTDTGLISGLFFAPSQAAQPYTAPDYVHTNAFQEEEVAVGQGEWMLPATLTIPEGQGSFPAVVLVHGSGPNDRDETIGPSKPFKDLAWGLASRGIAVLRYDKRTKVYAEKLSASQDGLTVKEETIDDALAAVSLLKQTERIDSNHIFVLGHSLGGMLAPRIAQANSEIAGLVIMAGPTRPLEDLFVEQTRYILSLSGQPSFQENLQLQAIEEQAQAIKALTASDASSQQILLGAPARYWLDLQEYHPAAVARELAIPMLVLQGERDYQVTMADFQGWQDTLSTRSNVTLKSYADLNHLFSSGAGRSTPSEYEQPGHVAAQVVDDIATWIANQ